MSVRYRAVQPIMFDGVLAHAPGDEVPAVNVERNGWSDLVEKITEPKPESKPAATKD